MSGRTYFNSVDCSFKYLKEVDVVFSLRKLLQLCVCSPELRDFPLDLLQQLLSLTDSCPLLASEELLHLTALLLNGTDEPGENPLTFLHCCLCGVLQSIKRHTKCVRQRF